MTADELKAEYKRTLRLLQAKPSFARGTGTSVARTLRYGACEVQTGSHTVRTDLPANDGGEDAAPTPGQLMRAALAACLVSGYQGWAVRRDVPMDHVEVEMTCELDARGQLGVEGVAPGWRRISWIVRVTSDAPRAAIEAVLTEADRLSPMLDSMDKSIVLERTIEIIAVRGRA